MGHDENKNDFGGTPNGVNSAAPSAVPTPATPSFGGANSTSSNAALEELRRISADSNPNAAPAPVTFTDSATSGDIILNKPKTSKKKFVILGLVFATILACVLLVLTLKIDGKNIINIGGAQDNEFVKYLLNGDGDVEISEEKSEVATLSEYADGEKMIYPLTFHSLMAYKTQRDNAIDSYFTTLHEKYNEYKANTKNPNDDNIKKLGVLIDVLENTVNYMKNIDEFAEMINYGADYNEVMQNLQEKYKRPEYQELGNVYDMYYLLYGNDISLMSVYKSVGCFGNKIKDFGCVMGSDNYGAVQYVNARSDKEGEIFNSLVKTSSVLNKEIIKTILAANNG